MKKMIIVLCSILIFAGCGGGAAGDSGQASEESNAAAEVSEPVTEPETEPETETAAEQELELPEVSKDVVTDADFDQFAPPAPGETLAVIKTNMGDITVKFFKEDAPKAVENFITHAKQGYYDGVIFHRVIDGFMIQGGDPTGTGMGGESIFGQSFEDEFTARLHNYRGALSMANAGPDTNGSQFFIVQAKTVDSSLLDFLKTLSEYEEAMYPDNRTGQIISGAQRFTQKAVDIYSTVGGTPSLDGGFPNQEGYVRGHTVFGQVCEGMDVVDAIAAVQTDDSDKPLEPVVIETILVTDGE